jgi:hypothetical protein
MRNRGKKFRGAPWEIHARLNLNRKVSLAGPLPEARVLQKGVWRFLKRHTPSPFQFLPALYQRRKLNSDHFVDQVRRNTMVNDAWKIIGLILSALWLLVAGCFEGLVICFVSFFYGLWALSLSILAYIVFGLGPVWAFILLMNKRYEPIDYRALRVLVFFAASPIFVVLYVLWHLHSPRHL